MATKKTRTLEQVLLCRIVERIEFENGDNAGLILTTDHGDRIRIASRGGDCTWVEASVLTTNEEFLELG